MSPQETAVGSEASEQVHCGYIGDNSVLAYSTDAVAPRPDGTLLPGEADPILAATRALETPSSALAGALIDFYFRELFPFVPVMDRHELQARDASPLLRQTGYFAGSLMRRPTPGPAAFSTRNLYIKIKTLLFLGAETESMTILRALSMLGSWSPNSPELVTLDCPWQWTGMAVRLALQLGLHKEATYGSSSDDKCRRRVMWYLFVCSCSNLA